MMRSIAPALLCLVAFAVPAAGAQAARNQTELVSRAPGAAGGPSDFGADSPRVSADGRFVAFTSAGTNLSPDDRDMDYDVYVRDMEAGTTVLVSRASGAAGSKGNGFSLVSAISADGRFIGFESQASNLSSDDRDTSYDVYVRDMHTSTTVLVSRAAGTGGAKGNGVSWESAISADGRFVAFESQATNLSSDDGDTLSDVFVRDLQTATTTLVSRAGGATGAKGDSHSFDAAISADGRFVAFGSSASNLHPDDTDVLSDVYVRDLQTGSVSLVSRASGAGGAKGSVSSEFPSISGDGRLVAFQSSASNLSPDDPGTRSDAFVRDLQTDTTTLVSRAGATVGDAIGNRDSVRPQLSRDGRFLAFISSATNLNVDDNVEDQDVYVRDLERRTTALVSRASGAGGAKGNLGSREAVLSGDGSFVAFTSRASNLTGDQDSVGDHVYRRQLLGNTAPVAAPDAYAMARDGALSVRAPGVLENDSDPDGDPLTAVLVSGPAHGTLNLDAQGGFAYTPARGYHGLDSFTYKATDGALDSPAVTVTITVNAPPVGVADAYTTTRDTSLSVTSPGVLENDSDPDGDPLHAKLLSEPVWGTVELRAQGGFDYTPSAGFHGVDSFRYVATDGALDSAIVTVTITVNSAPVAAADAYATAEDTRLSVAAPGVLGNDSDADGDSLRALLVSLPAHGTLELAGDGGFSYTPAAGYHGSDSFTYKALDDDDRLASAAVRVTIAVNARPVAAPDAYATPAGTRLTVTAPGVLGNDSDPEGDPLRAVRASAPAHGTLDLGADGGFSYTPEAGFHGSDSFTYRAGHDDDGPGSPAVTVTISVKPQPPSPPPAVTPPASLPVKPRCMGRDATIVGTPGADSLRGTPRADVIVALGGNDVVRGLGGNDRVCAGAGNDRVEGGAGADRLAGAAGTDLVLGGPGTDLLLGDAGADTLRGGPGKDRMNGGPGRDRSYQ